MTGDTVVRLMSAMLEGRTRTLYLVLDNLPVHNSKQLKNYVKSTHGMLELHLFPSKSRRPPLP